MATTLQEIIDYVNNTTYNTNPSVIKALVTDYSGSNKEWNGETGLLEYTFSTPLQYSEEYECDVANLTDYTFSQLWEDAEKSYNEESEEYDVPMYYTATDGTDT